MITDLKPYAEYKDSGLPWLGQVPGHWEVRRLKSHVLRNDAGVWGAAFDDRGTAVLRSTEQSIDGGWRIANPARILLSEGQRRAALLELGDLVITKSSGSALHIGKTSLVTPQVAAMQCCFSNFMQRLRVSRAVSPRFAWILLNSRVGREQFVYQSTTTTGLGNLNGTILGNCTFSFPPLDEQAAIVRFLDWANGRLERAIRAKRKVISLLNEQKQAIIHRAVTRGLDPSVPLKDSGVPWLGEIPAHWEVRRLRTLVNRIEQGVSPLAVGFLAEGNSWGVLKSGCVNRGTFRETEHKQLASSFEIDPAIVVEVGDVLISRACGSPSLVGSVGRVKSLQYQLILSDKTFRAAFRAVVDEDFMVFAMNCRYYRQQVEQAISGADGMANNLPLSSLRGFNFAIPPKVEAVAIADYLEARTISIDTAISRLEREITLLREYRTRLVADVVTGKLDVREAAAALPDEEPLAEVTDLPDLDDEFIDNEDSNDSEMQE